MSMGDSFCSILYLHVQSFLLQDSIYNLPLPIIDTLSWKSPAYDFTFILLLAENSCPAVAPWSSPPLYTFTVHSAFPCTIYVPASFLSLVLSLTFLLCPHSLSIHH